MLRGLSRKRQQTSDDAVNMTTTIFSTSAETPAPQLLKPQTQEEKVELIASGLQHPPSLLMLRSARLRSAAPTTTTAATLR
jgi:hypothetical protein